MLPFKSPIDRPWPVTLCLPLLTCGLTSLIFLPNAYATGSAKPVSNKILSNVMGKKSSVAPLRHTTSHAARHQGEDITVNASKFGGVTREATGGGLITAQTAPKARSTIGQDYIAKQAPAQNAYNFTKMAPGVVVANTNPAGHEKSALSMRGLTQDEIANTYENMPLSSVGGYNLDLAWIIDSENIHNVTVQPGSANLDTQAINGSGGRLHALDARSLASGRRDG